MELVGHHVNMNREQAESVLIEAIGGCHTFPDVADWADYCGCHVSMAKKCISSMVHRGLVKRCSKQGYVMAECCDSVSLDGYLRKIGDK